MENRVYFNRETSELAIMTEKPSNDWVMLPKKMGIKWHSDQSCNELIANYTRNDVNYVLDTVKEFSILEEYKDQIENMYS